ncbi:hypothetical protein N7451_008453, partial [Penicillium sp. IBT 35674x]
GKGAVSKKDGKGDRPAGEAAGSPSERRQSTVEEKAVEKIAALFGELSFINELRWKIFGICAQSECFQTGFISRTIFDNRRSIDIFARSRVIQWRGLLLTYTQYNLPGLDDKNGIFLFSRRPLLTMI